MARIFISYKRDADPDQKLAGFLAERFRGQGHKVFIDIDVEVGERWGDAIENAIAQCDFFLIFVSEHSTRSEWVLKELREAHARTVSTGVPRILPIRVCMPDARLPYEFGAKLDSLQYASVESESQFDDVFAQLAGAIQNDRALPQTPPPTTSTSAVSEDMPLPAEDIDHETGTLRTDSPFYVRRDADARAEDQVSRDGSTTLVRGPRQIGKSSLLVRMHENALGQGRRSWYLDFQLVDRGPLENLDQLCKYLAGRAGRAFRAAIRPADAWDDFAGPKQNLTDYLEDAVLATSEPAQIVFDEADLLFHRDYRNDFFAMVRGWHNLRATNDRWQQLNIAIGHSTAPMLWIHDPNQSPFNVGERIELPDFNATQISWLNEKYGRPLKSEVDVDSLLDLVGGHPFLVRLALYTMVNNGWTLEQLDATAVNEPGPFADHLQAILWRVLRSDELQSALRTIVLHNRCDDEEHFQRLLAAGLVRGSSRADVRTRCALYERYFRNKL